MAERTTKTDAAKALKADRVEISERAQNTLASKLAAFDPLERSRMVDEIKAKYEQGELEIDADAIAEEMLKNGYFEDITGN